MRPLPLYRPSQTDERTGSLERARNPCLSSSVNQPPCVVRFIDANAIVVFIAHWAMVNCCNISSGVDMSCARHPTRGILAVSSLDIQPLLQVLQAHLDTTRGLLWESSS